MKKAVAKKAVAKKASRRKRSRKRPLAKKAAPKKAAPKKAAPKKAAPEKGSREESCAEKGRRKEGCAEKEGRQEIRPPLKSSEWGRPFVRGQPFTILARRTGLATTARHFSNNWMSASAYSSADFDGLPENPAAALLPFPYPVVTAMNFISSSATSSRFFAASLALSAAVVLTGFFWRQVILSLVVDLLSPQTRCP